MYHVLPSFLPQIVCTKSIRHNRTQARNESGTSRRRVYFQPRALGCHHGGPKDTEGYRRLGWTWKPAAVKGIPKMNDMSNWCDGHFHHLPPFCWCCVGWFILATIAQRNDLASSRFNENGQCSHCNRSSKLSLPNESKCPPPPTT